jgi:dTDP-4-amino-4,6-dideoxygalactose transaminase
VKARIGCEHAARAQLTLPLYPHLGEERLLRVVNALRESLDELDS